LILNIEQHHFSISSSDILLVWIYIFPTVDVIFLLPILFYNLLFLHRCQSKAIITAPSNSSVIYLMDMLSYKMIIYLKMASELIGSSIWPLVLLICARICWYWPHYCIMLLCVYFSSCCLEMVLSKFCLIIYFLLIS